MNVTHSAASFVQTDDLETFTRCQRGLDSEGSEWLYINRGLGDDITEPNRPGLKGKATNELVARNMYKAWAEYMSETE